MGYSNMTHDMKFCNMDFSYYVNNIALEVGILPESRSYRWNDILFPKNISHKYTCMWYIFFRQLFARLC